MMRALILAAGEAKRWGNYMDVPKHMIPIKDMPLIHRTQQMLWERYVRDIVVVAQEDREHYVTPYARRESPLFYPRLLSNGDTWHQEWDSSLHLWPTDEPVIILYGDVYFTEALMDAITRDPADTWKVYARHGASQRTGKAYGEMFGWVIPPGDMKHLRASQAVAASYRSNGLWNRCLGWETYRIATKNVPWHHAKDDVHFKDWDDESDDFDDPKDWDVWAKLNPALAY